MDSVEFCRQTLLELRERLKGATAYDVARMAGLLRQLLFDKHSLLRTAAKQSGKKFVFITTTELQAAIDVTDASPHCLMFAPGNMNPTSGEKGTEVSVDAYGGLLALVTQGQSFSVRQVVKFVANKRGGVHLDGDRDGDEAKLEDLAQQVEVYGLDAVLAQLACIADNTVQSAVACGWIER